MDNEGRFIVTKSKTPYQLQRGNFVYFVKEYVDDTSPPVVIAACSTELNAARVKRALKIVESRYQQGRSRRYH